MKIALNKSVSVSYELYVRNEDGKLEMKEKATAENPFVFIAGIGMMLPEFEQHLLGLSVGDKYDFEIKSENAYGEYCEEKIFDLEPAAFEVDGKIDENILFEGNFIPLRDTEGNQYRGLILEVTENNVRVDINHPLAGQDLRFEGEVIDVHDVTEEELAALYGGCGGCNCGCEDENHTHEHDCAGCGC
ncbi:MAG: FKBP-type peptidyl-prolyl cis-trans isomerase [Prevotellaceae bacterium]|jgi:FKBP-type peptidyl-prolyl cis-trans isomerase SlyD|nr:FKBP-type peptidyl-prolyl cis-trans isomerase [Prevotellaceae bacterium]